MWSRMAGSVSLEVAFMKKAPRSSLAPAWRPYGQAVTPFHFHEATSTVGDGKVHCRCLWACTWATRRAIAAAVPTAAAAHPGSHVRAISLALHMSFLCPCAVCRSTFDEEAEVV